MTYLNEDSQITRAIGARLRERRRSLNAAQATVADHLGVSQATISRVERGEAPTSTAWTVLEDFLRSLVSELRTLGGQHRVGRLVDA
jgi:transcriptional regulator with XRE-family HTH domain